MEERAKYVLWFEECGLGQVPLVGGKNASLGELIKAGIPVPPGFAVTTWAYDRFLKMGKIREEILALLREIKEGDVIGCRKASSEIRELIENTSMDEELEDYIGETYRQLSLKCRVPAVPVAVRSSATAEDLPDASFAGQQDTFLWIRGIDGVLTYVRKCWSSLFTPRAITYRTKHGFEHDKVSISVGIQKMVNSFAAGVMFTVNPTTGDPSTIVIDANWGFGESVVSGEVTPDNFVVNKVLMEITSRTVSLKECYYGVNFETHSVERREMPSERSSMQCITDAEVIELARIGKLIEEYYGKPMDIEWAIDRDMPGASRIMIVQSRPETVWSQKASVPEKKSKTSGIDFITATILHSRKDD